MKTSFLPALVCTAALLIPALRAETLDERDFKQARANRDKALATAAEPINRHYKEDLEKIFRRATQAAELDLAKEIQAELQVVGGMAAVTAATATTGTSTTQTTSPTGDKTDLRKLIEETEWQSAKGHSFFFQRGGNFASSGSWGSFYTLEAPDILKLWDRDPKKDRKATFRLLHVNAAEKTAEMDIKASTAGGELSLKYVGPAKTPKK